MTQEWNSRRRWVTAGFFFICLFVLPPTSGVAFWTHQQEKNMTVQLRRKVCVTKRAPTVVALAFHGVLKVLSIPTQTHLETTQFWL